MGVFRVGVFLGGSCQGGNFLGGNFHGWKLSRWDLSQVGIFFGGSFPGGNCLVGIIRVAIFRVGVSCYQVDMHKLFISISRRSREVRAFYLQRTVMSFVTYSLEFNFCPKFFFCKGYFYSIYSIFFRAIFQYRSDADLLQTYQKCWIFLFQFNSKYSCQPYCNNKVYNNSLYQ